MAAQCADARDREVGVFVVVKGRAAAFPFDQVSGHDYSPWQGHTLMACAGGQARWHLASQQRAARRYGQRRQSALQKGSQMHWQVD